MVANRPPPESVLLLSNTSIIGLNQLPATVENLRKDFSEETCAFENPH